MRDTYLRHTDLADAIFCNTIMPENKVEEVVQYQDEDEEEIVDFLPEYDESILDVDIFTIDE